MNKEKQKIVPEVRFPEFENNWEKIKLKDVSKYFNGKSFEGDVQEEGKYELITLKSIDSSGRLVHSKRYINDEVPTLKKGTLVMILSEQAPGLLGMTAIIPSDNKFVLNQRVAEIRPNDKVVSFFLSMAINRNQRTFSRLGAGMKVQNISKPNVENYEFYYPTLAEQQKIANCLSSLDNVITAETEKLDYLKDHKKGLLQQLFPAKGETKPQFRFSEFKNDGDWVTDSLGSLVEIKGRIGYRGYTKKDIVAKGKGAITLSPSNFDKNGKLNFEKTTYITWKKYDESPEIMLEEGQTVLVKTASVGKSAYVGDLPEKATINPQIVVLKPQKIEPKFLAYTIFHNYVQNQIKESIGAGAIPNMSQASIANFEILLPPGKDGKEQQKIANCLSSADDLIQAQKTKIKNLKNHKKGLLQQLFPNNL